MVIKTTLELKNFNLFLSLLSKTKGKIVCVDIDNTLANINFLLKKLGYSIKKYPAKLPAGFWETHTGIKLLQEAQPIPETIAVINLFRDAGAEVVFATARGPELARITEEWLTAHRLEGEVFYVHSKTLVEADVYVEDSPQEIRRILKLGSKVLVPEWPYNRISHRNIINYRIGRGF
jgi:uncharacterized HAD superfamily protein